VPDTRLSLVLSRPHYPQQICKVVLNQEGARDEGKRPSDGVTSMPWKNGLCLIWDVTCPDTLAASYLKKAVTGPGVVATEAETKKRQKYSSVDDSVYIFQPIAIETLGAFGISAIEFFDDLGHNMYK